MQEEKQIQENIQEKSGSIGKWLTFLPFGIFAILYMTVWADIETTVEDPWFAAVKKVDIGAREKDPAIRKAKMDEGGNELRALVQKYPKHARIHYFMGFYFSAIGDLDSTIFYCKNAIEMGKGALVNQVDGQAMTLVSQVALGIASKQIQEKKFEDGIRTIKKALPYNPNDPNFYYMLGVSFQNLNVMDSARANYENSLAIDANHNAGKENLANLYFMYANDMINKGQSPQAEEILRKAIALAPNFGPAYNSLGVALLKQNKAKDAITFLERAVYLNPKETNFKTNLDLAKKTVGV